MFPRNQENIPCKCLESLFKFDWFDKQRIVQTQESPSFAAMCIHADIHSDAQVTFIMLEYELSTHNKFREIDKVLC